MEKRGRHREYKGVSRRVQRKDECGS